MTNKTILTFVIACVVIAGAIVVIKKHHSASATPAPSIDLTGSSTPEGIVSTSTSAADLPANHFVGMVNLKEIGGKNLTVTTPKGISTLGADGAFARLPANASALTVVIVSENASSTRGYAIAFPDTTTLTIDAKSTAESALIDTSATVAVAHNEIAIIDGLKCFPAYVSYLQTMLPKYSLEQLQNMKDINDPKNPRNVCSAEIQAYVKAHPGS